MTGASESFARRHGGHTLWEVLLVLALVGAVAALVAPVARVVWPTTVDVTSTARDLVALLERARLTALERGTTVEIHLDPLTGRSWVFGVEGDTLRLLATTTLRRASAVDIRAARSRVRFVFSPEGEAFGEPLDIRGPGGAQRITVDPWTGGARVETR